MADSTKYLILGGSTKCGTTSVFKYFEYHPEICACILKESRYFLENDYKLIGGKRDKTTYTSFDQLFSDCRDNAIRFEATPDYLYSEFAADKIKSEIPDVKLVFILRNPVQRLLSWFKFASLNGLFEQKDLTIEEYVNLQNKNASAPQHMRSLEQGRYADYLQYYYKLFPAGNIKIMLYEDLDNDPLSFCNELAAFAGCDPSYFNTYEFRIHNKSQAVKSVGAHRLFRKIKRTVRPATRLLNQRIRKRLKLAGYNIEKAYLSANTTGNFSDLKIPENTLEFLTDYYRDSIIRLHDMTGINPNWEPKNKVTEK